MKIRSLAYEEIRMPLKEPYQIAYETISETTNIFLTLITDTEMKGYGCAAPDLEVTQETPQSVISALNQVAEPLLHGADPLQIARLMEQLRKECHSHPSLLAMIDMALYDLIAKIAGLPLYLLLGGYRHSIPTSITIGILPVKETVEKAEEFIRQGFNVLKIKGGKHVDLDVERLFAVREKLGSQFRLRFDANQGYTLEEAIRFVEATRKCEIEIFEQPMPREAQEKMGKLAGLVHLPVMADESLLNLQDAHNIARNGWADMVNIKLMKVGGILQAMHINSVAKAAGMEAMVGCMDESELGIAAGLHFALSRPNVEYADLDGHFDLENDPASGCVLLRNGVLFPSGQPGLGFK